MTERLPTVADFQRILAGIVPASISPDAQASMEAGIKEYIMQDLEGQTMTEEDMEQLAYALQHHFQQSLVPVGEAVGPLAALSTGEPATQMQLSAHRIVGTASKTTNEGIPRFQELLRATLQQKAISASIHFWERQTLASVRQLSSLFVYRTLADFLELDGASVGKVAKIGEVPDESMVDWNEEWHEDYRILQNYREDTPTYVLRLRLNREEIMRYGLTPDMVAEKLKSSYPEPIYVYSPADVAIIDVHAKRPILSESAPYITEANVLAFYLRDILLPSLKEVHMIGIPKITAAFPRQQELSSFITSWKGKSVQVNRQKAELQGARPEDLIPLLSGAGYQPMPTMEGDTIVLGVAGGNLSQLSDKVLANPELRNLNGTWYLETNGSNLAEILAMDIVNTEVTFCTDVTEIYAVFGIQAARDYLLDQFIHILSSDSYMDPRHLILLADVMTNMGLLAPATSSGVSRQKIGPLTRAAFERPVEHFLLAAGFGETEAIKGVAASVFAGKLANIGPEAFAAPSALQQVVEEDEEEQKNDVVVLPDTLTLEPTVPPPILIPMTATRRVLPTKVSMYARKEASVPASAPIASRVSAPAPITAPVPTVVLPDTLTLEPAKPVSTSAPPIRQGTTLPRRIGSVVSRPIPSVATPSTSSTTSVSNTIPSASSTPPAPTKPPSRPLPPRRF